MKSQVVRNGTVRVVALIALGIGASQITAQAQGKPAFEVVSVRPYKSLNPGTGKGGDLRSPVFLPGGRFTSRAPLIMVIGTAFDVPFSGPTARISGGPAWINALDLVYDIEATPAKNAASAEEERLMLQALLADRFKLAVRHEEREMPVYALTVGKDGPKLPPGGYSGK